MKPSIYLKGIDALERKCDSIIKKINKEEKKILLKQARVVRDKVKSKAPKGPTGNLKKACYATAYAANSNSQALAFAGIRPRKAPHAHLVEYGHGGPHPAPPHPFFRPAWDEVRGSVTSAVEIDLKKTVEGAV